MKKYYRKLKIKLILLLTVVILVGCCGIIYQKADRIREDYIYELDDFRGEIVSVRRDEIKDEDDLIKKAYQAYYNANVTSDAGFYSMVKNRRDGSTVAEWQNFMIVTRWATSEREEDIRIIPLGDDTSKIDEKGWHTLVINAYSLMEIVGNCDNNYIYLQELRWFDSLREKSYTYTPDNKIEPPEGAICFEKWAGSFFFEEGSMNNVYHAKIKNMYGAFGWESANSLVKEAKKECEKIYDDIISGKDTKDDQSKTGLFTCIVAGTGYLDENYSMPYVYVFHPVNLAIDELSGVLFLIAVMWLIMIFIVIGLVNQVYRKQLAHEANRLNLTRGIAHELKTPLAITKGYVESWKYVKEADREKYSETMLEEMEHMDHMVMDLLELSRLEAKRKEPNPEPVDIYGISLSVLKRMSSLVEERGLTVTDRTGEKSDSKGPGLVSADLEMMRTVIANFVTNALKYADKAIDFSVVVTEKKVRFVISNDGRTIESDKINKIWDEFYMDGIPDGSTGSAGSGDRLGSSGLGLAIAKNILELHKAKYGCESKDGRTTFWFEMKRISEE